MELHELSESARQVYLQRMKKQLDIEQREFKQLVGNQTSNHANPDKIACQQIFEGLFFEQEGTLKKFATDMKNYAVDTEANSSADFPNITFDNISMEKVFHYHAKI